MDNFYLILVVVLFALAISDLIVGVSNDAVNFLNSAIGSKSASFKTIMVIAALGIFIGASFSSGMMEVARKGIFNPQHFFFSEIMIIFIAVMITDVILLDMFNTLGLPTSTTVSIVFELLGAAIAVSIIKISNNPELPLSEYINTAKALAIISGILLSVIVSFSAGAIIQYITRLTFSFNYSKRIKYLGAIWGGIAITAITYFILIKGAKSATFMSKDTKQWISENTQLIIVYGFIGWTILLQISNWLFKLNILKFTVLVGTFALAMAFSGNDLVNFIGVPLAGFESFKVLNSTPGATPDSLLMTSMAGKVHTAPYMLIIAGLIMVATLWTSKKAKNVVKTSLDLSRQHEGDERFGSSFLARSIVRATITMNQNTNKFLPAKVKSFISKQFDSTEYELNRQKLGKEAPAFDMLRASVNLVVASILISLATSYKLPLSTTYVTFMVAMGSSLTDRAWGRESAVYRITGVLSVVGGWFFTAFSAFTAAFLVAILIATLGNWMIFVFLIAAILFIIRTHKVSKAQKAIKQELTDFDIEEINGEIHSTVILEKCTNSVSEVLNKLSELYDATLTGFETENRKLLKETSKNVDSINQKTKKLKNNVFSTVQKLQEESIDSSVYYVQVIDYLRETAHSISFITNPLFEHLDNNHKTFIPDQFKELNIIKLAVRQIIEDSISIIKEGNFDTLNTLIENQQNTLEGLKNLRKKQLKRIKKDKAGTKVSLLYLNVLHETQNLMLHIGNLLKAQRDFVAFHK